MYLTLLPPWQVVNIEQLGEPNRDFRFPFAAPDPEPASQQDVHSESAGSQVQFCASQPRLSASNDPR